jgi:hypothetical protein
MKSTEDRSANGKFSLLECSAVKWEDDRAPSEGSLPTNASARWFVVGGLGNLSPGCGADGIWPFKVQE